ncbi:MAG TPA: transposase [Prevotella sp.]|nr:transposase [Prevotella sp.]
MISAYQYRIYPSEQQKHNLAIHFGHNRYIWNEALRFIKYHNNGKYTSREKMQLRLTQIKKEITWLPNAHSQTLQATLKRLDIAFQRFFKKQSGYPKTKRRNTEQSIEFPQSSKVDFSLNCVKLPKIGYVRAKLHQKFKGDIKTCYVGKTPSNEYYACFVIDDGLPLPEVNTDVEPTGIDLGIKELVIGSNGKKYGNNKYLKQKLRHLRKAMKTMARRSKKKNKLVTDKEMFGPYSKENPLQSFMQVKEVWSNRREKARLQVARIYRDIVNCRNDYLHKVSRELVDENDGLVFENLNIRGMVRNRRLAQAIMDCAWGKLIQLCEYKSARAGKVCIKIDTFFASSKTCSTCENKYHGLTLNERTWTCEHCGSRHDRDVNAALNISAEGKRLLEQMIKNGDFENQEKPRKSRYGNKKKDSILESVKQSAGLAERGEVVSRESVFANFIEACQEKHPGDAEATSFRAW